MICVRLVKSFLVSDNGDLDRHSDVVMDQLINLEDELVSDSDVSVDFEKCSIEISVLAKGESFEGAMEHADSTIRSAIHAAGGSTPRWSKVTFELQKSEADLVPA